MTINEVSYIVTENVQDSQNHACGLLCPGICVSPSWVSFLKKGYNLVYSHAVYIPDSIPNTRVSLGQEGEEAFKVND